MVAEPTPAAADDPVIQQLMGEIHLSLCESMPKGLILCSELASRVCSPSLGVILTAEGLPPSGVISYGFFFRWGGQCFQKELSFCRLIVL